MAWWCAGHGALGSVAGIPNGSRGDHRHGLPLTYTGITFARPPAHTLFSVSIEDALAFLFNQPRFFFPGAQLLASAGVVPEIAERNLGDQSRYIVSAPDVSDFISFGGQPTDVKLRLDRERKARGDC